MNFCSQVFFTVDDQTSWRIEGFRGCGDYLLKVKKYVMRGSAVCKTESGERESSSEESRQIPVIDFSREN